MDAQIAPAPLKGVKAVVAGACVVVFLAYWAATCFFNFPSTSIVIGENYKAYTWFNAAFFQRWTFFAPPPTYNYRMNYIYTTPEKVHTVEVFETLNKKVQEQYLANDMYTNISWMLFANADALIDFMGKSQQLLQLRADDTTQNARTAAKQYKEARSMAQHTKSMGIILTHAKNLAERMHIGRDYTLTVKISTVALPRYHERGQKTAKRLANTLFVSSPYSSKTKTWVD